MPSALEAQMFMRGGTDEGSSRLPMRTTRNWGQPDDLAKRCVPQPGQNWRVTSLPLAAFFVCSESVPDTTSASAGTSMFTVPFAARCWQSRHQQTRVTRGSAASLNLTAPHRQRPVLSLMSNYPSACRAKKSDTHRNTSSCLSRWGTWPQSLRIAITDGPFTWLVMRRGKARDPYSSRSP
jgi:hypothetical protein